VFIPAWDSPRATLLELLSHKYSTGKELGAGALPDAMLAAVHGENLVLLGLSAARGVERHIGVCKVYPPSPEVVSNLPKSIKSGGGGPKQPPPHPSILPPRAQTPLTLYLPRSLNMWEVHREVYGSWVISRGGKPDGLIELASLYATGGGSTPPLPLFRDTRLRKWVEEEGRALDSFSTLGRTGSHAPLFPADLANPGYEGLPTAVFALETRPHTLLPPGLAEDDALTMEMLGEWRPWGIDVPPGGVIIGVRAWTKELAGGLHTALGGVFGGRGVGEGSVYSAPNNAAAAAAAENNSGGPLVPNHDGPPCIWTVLREAEADNPMMVLRKLAATSLELKAALQTGEGEGSEHPVTVVILPFSLASAVSYWVNPNSPPAASAQVSTINPSSKTRSRAALLKKGSTNSAPMPAAFSEGLVVLPPLSLPTAKTPQPSTSGSVKMIAKFGSRVLIPDPAVPSVPPTSTLAELQEASALESFSRFEFLKTCGVCHGDEIIVIPHGVRQSSISPNPPGGSLPSHVARAIDTLRALCGLATSSLEFTIERAPELGVVFPQVPSSSAADTNSPSAPTTLCAPMRLLITSPTSLLSNLITATAAPAAEELQIFGYCGGIRGGIRKEATRNGPGGTASRASRAVAAAAAASTSPTPPSFPIVVHKGWTVSEVKIKAVAVINVTRDPAQALSVDACHLARVGRGGSATSFTSEEDTLVSLDIGEGEVLFLRHGAPLQPLHVMIHARIILPTSSPTVFLERADPSTNTGNPSRDPLLTTFPFPLTSRVSSLRRALIAKLSGYLPPSILSLSPASLRLRAGEDGHGPTSAAAKILRDELVLRSALSLSQGKTDERYITVEVLDREEVIRPGDACVKIRQLACVGDGTHAGETMAQCLRDSVAEGSASGVEEEEEDKESSYHLCPSMDAIFPTTFPTPLSMREALHRLIFLNSCADQTLIPPPDSLAVAVVGAFVPAVTTWEALHRLNWNDAMPRITEGCTVVWRVMTSPVASVVAQPAFRPENQETTLRASGRGASAVSSLKSTAVGREKENGPAVKPWANRGGKPPMPNSQPANFTPKMLGQTSDCPVEQRGL